MENKSSIVLAAILIVVGAFLLVTRVFPVDFDIFKGPFIVMGVGVIFLVAAILTRNGALAIPGSIIGGIGGILYYQELTGNWSSWSYAWTLIPGFVGVGILLSGLIARDHARFDSGGLVLIALSAIGFLIFGGAFGLGWEISQYWPVLLIGVGVIVLISALFQKK